MGILQSFVDGWNGQEDDNDESLFAYAPVHGEKTGEDLVRDAKLIRDNQSEHQIDKTLQDSFPASDPPAWY